MANPRAGSEFGKQIILAIPLSFANSKSLSQSEHRGLPANLQRNHSLHIGR